MTVDFESKTICTFSQIELSQMSQARMQSKQGAEWLIIKRWPDYRRYQTGHLLHSACITDTSLHVSLIPHYMYYWYLITCITDTSLHVSLIPHYMHHWYFITCITDTSLHVSLIPHYMYHWYLITCITDTSLQTIVYIIVVAITILSIWKIGKQSFFPDITTIHGYRVHTWALNSPFIAFSLYFVCQHK